MGRKWNRPARPLRPADRARWSLAPARPRKLPAPMTRPEYYGNPAGVTGDLGRPRGLRASRAATSMPRSPTSPRTASWTPAAPPTRPAQRLQGHDGVRQYFADVAAVWDELVLHADDFRVLPGSVVVIGHVTGRRGEERIKRSVVWTWKVRDGRAVSAKVSDMGPLAG